MWCATKCIIKYICIYTWLDFYAVIVVIVIVVRALRDISGERRVAGLHAATLGLSFSRLNAVLLHGGRPVDTVQFVVKTTSVADRFAHCVATPKRRHSGLAIATRQTHASRSGLRKYKIFIICVAAASSIDDRRSRCLSGNKAVAKRGCEKRNDRSLERYILSQQDKRYSSLGNL